MNPSAPSIVAQGKYSGMVPLPPYLTGQYQGAPQSAAGSAPLPTTPPPPPPSPPPSSAKAANELSSTRETPWGLESPVAVENNGAAAPSSGEGVEHKAEEADAALPSSDPLLRVQNAASEGSQRTFFGCREPQRAFFGRVRRAMMEAIRTVIAVKAVLVAPRRTSREKTDEYIRLRKYFRVQVAKTAGPPHESTGRKPLMSAPPQRSSTRRGKAR